MVAEPSNYDTKRFKSQFHESRYHRLIESKKVISETGFRLNEGEYPIMRRIVRERKWELLCEPLTDISAVMIREFYANAVRESKDSLPYKSYVRGEDVDFSPAAVMRVLQLRTVTYGELSFEDRLQGENDPDEILHGLCLEGRDWERDSDGAPSHLKRTDLKPEAKGWLEVTRRSIFPTANTSEVTIKRAILVYCILKGREINIPQLIADSIQEIAYEGKSRLGHPSTILRLCNRAGVLFEDEDTEKVAGTRGITKKFMDGATDCADTQEERRSQGRRRRLQVEGEQAFGTLDLSLMQRTIEEMSQQFMKAQEQQQEQYLRQQEQYLKDREERENWQRQMMEQQEKWQQQMIAQQQEFQTKILEGQKEQSADFRESYNTLSLRQAKYGEYTQNLYQWKNIFHTVGDHRSVDRIEYDKQGQVKLDYLVHNMPTLNQEIRQNERVMRNVAHMWHGLEIAGLSSQIDDIWDRRCPTEEPKEKRKKRKNKESNRMEMRDN